MLEFLSSTLKSAPAWLNLAFEVMLVIFIAMLFVSIICGLWMAGAILKRKQSYIAEVSVFPPKIVFHPKETKELSNDKQE